MGLLFGLERRQPDLVFLDAQSKILLHLLGFRRNASGLLAAKDTRLVEVHREHALSNRHSDHGGSVEQDSHWNL